MHPGNTLLRRTLRLPLLSAGLLSLAGCWTPVCDARFGECPGTIQPDAGAPSLDAAMDAGTAPDAAVAPDAGPECVPGTWEFETVTPLAKDGLPRAAADLAIDSGGDVLLTYANGPSRYFARRSRSGWSAPILLGAGFRNPPTGSVSLGSSGVLAVWGDDMYEGGAIGVAALLPGADWTRTSMERCPQFGCAHPRLATDASGVSHLAYVRPWADENEFLYSRLQYAVRTADGTWSESEFVKDAVAFEVSIAVGPDGPHLAYVDVGHWELRHATRVDGTWRIETVREDTRDAMAPSLSVDDSGGVHLGFQHFSQDARWTVHAYAHRPPGGTWVLEDVGERQGSLPGSAFVTTHAGQALLALQTDSFVGVSRRTATGWQTERVASVADVESRDTGPVLRVDARGGLHLVYPDWEAGTLVYARQCPAP